MTKTRPYAELSAKVNADPASRARVEQYKQAVEDAVRVAEALDASEEVSRVEREEDEYISMLRSYIEDMGGRLELRAIFPHRAVVLAPMPTPPEQLAERESGLPQLSQVGS